MIYLGLVVIYNFMNQSQDDSVHCPSICCYPKYQVNHENVIQAICFIFIFKYCIVLVFVYLSHRAFRWVARPVNKLSENGKKIQILMADARHFLFRPHGLRYFYIQLNL